MVSTRVAIIFKMSRTVPSSLGAEAQAMSVALGFVEWATLFLQEPIHRSFDLRGAPAVMRERPQTSCVCHRLCESARSFVGSWEPSNAARPRGLPSMCPLFESPGRRRAV